MSVKRKWIGLLLWTNKGRLVRVGGESSTTLRGWGFRAIEVRSERDWASVVGQSCESRQARRGVAIAIAAAIMAA
jgi:hypothetical protein